MIWDPQDETSPSDDEPEAEESLDPDADDEQSSCMSESVSDALGSSP